MTMKQTQVELHRIHQSGFPKGVELLFKEIIPKKEYKYCGIYITTDNFTHIERFIKETYDTFEKMYSTSLTTFDDLSEMTNQFHTLLEQITCCEIGTPQRTRDAIKKYVDILNEQITHLNSAEKDMKSALETVQSFIANHNTNIKKYEADILLIKDNIKILNENIDKHNAITEKYPTDKNKQKQQQLKINQEKLQNDLKTATDIIIQHQNNNATLNKYIEDIEDIKDWILKIQHIRNQNKDMCEKINWISEIKYPQINQVIRNIHTYDLQSTIRKTNTAFISENKNIKDCSVETRFKIAYIIGTLESCINASKEHLELSKTVFDMGFSATKSVLALIKRFKMMFETDHGKYIKK